MSDHSPVYLTSALRYVLFLLPYISDHRLTRLISFMIIIQIFISQFIKDRLEITSVQLPVNVLFGELRHHGSRLGTIE